MLVGLWRHHVPVDLILFADPGAEQPHTYAYLDTMSRWLENHGMPAITRVWYTEKNGQRLTLEQECLRSGTLPSIAYGYKKCSLKHYLPPALVAAMRGTVQDSENRIARLLFKLAVEVNMMMNVLAAGMEISDEDLKTLRARSVREVKQTNGRISFKDAIDYQRGVE